jgi:uncharacterized membrane protein
MTWAGFAAVFTLFFVSHSIPVRPGIKSWFTARIGARGFGVGYSALSLAMLTLVIWSAGEAPHVQLWPQLGWHRHAAHMGMLAVCLILALSIARPNPFSFGGAHDECFDPTRPGIVRWTRHPILLALAIWAGVHLLPNGDLAHVLLFGVLGSFALAGRRLIDHRKRQALGAGRWSALDTARKAAPRVHSPRSWPALVSRLLIGLGLFVFLLHVHATVIGVAAL